MSGAGTDRSIVIALFIVAAGTLGTGRADGAVTLLGVQYQPDLPYVEHQCIWHDRNYPTSCGTVVVGANAYVFIRNTGSSAVTVSDVTLAGTSLQYALKAKGDANSIFYRWTNPPQALLDAGEPVWYKADPNPVPAGGSARIVVRLRFTPKTPTVSVGVVTSAGTVTAAIPVAADAPQLASAAFSPDRTRVTLHWRRSGGAAPASVLMDGTDVTASTTTVGDPALSFAASVVQLAQPLAPSSFHVFQGVYADGKTATAGMRAWVNPFIYATWCTRPVPDGDLTAARAWIDDATSHGFNAAMNQLDGAGLADLFGTASGRQYAADRGYGLIIDSVNKFNCSNPLLWFIDDEPDTRDSRVDGLPAGEGHNAGVVAMSRLATGEALRAANPLSPTAVNIDGTYRPTNYYNWGQVADVLMVDPYYQRRLVDAYWRNPNLIPLYRKATYIYAVAQAVTTACEPNPSYVILYSCEFKDTSTGQIWPFPTVESKRIEVYYALAAGAKGMAYWWLKPGYPSNGLGAGGTAANALWKEIGLLGNEIKTAAPLLVSGHPVNLPLQTSGGVWARALAVGIDTLLILAVNDQYYNDQAGCHYTPVGNAVVTATLPAWMPSPSAFEITAAGLADVSTQTAGNQLQVHLGTLDLTRMIVVTRDPALRDTIRQRYEQLVRPGVCAFAPELCVTGPPGITQHPADRAVCPGGTATFSVTASGSGPLSFRWQRNQADLSNGGHYSGATTATLIVSNADAGDLGDYRCVVSSGPFSASSNPASLTLRAATAISGHPQPQAIALNGTAVFTVTATGEGPLAYQWQRNGSDLADGGHYSGTATATLTVSNADGSDTGGYRCVVTGGCGPAISNAAALTVGVPGDLDSDGDVDLDDFGLLQACMDATTVRPADPRCADANLDKDPFGAVTQADLAIFRKCLTGAEKPADPACAN